jgi:hypothetical protein
MMSKFFEVPMAAQHACCDESTVLTDDSRASCSDRSTTLGGQDSADYEVRPNLARTKEATQVRKQIPTSARLYTCSSQHIVLHPVQPAKVTGIKETAPANMRSKSKIAKDGLAPDARPPLRVGRSDSALLPAARRKHTRYPVRVNKSFEAATLGGRPHQKQATTKAVPLPLGYQQVLTRRESIRRLSPPRIPAIAKCTKQRRDKPPVETIQFETHSFTDMMGDTSTQVKEEEDGISSYLQLEITYPACEIESGTAFLVRAPTSALAQLRIAWYVD